MEGGADISRRAHLLPTCEKTRLAKESGKRNFLAAPRLLGCLNWRVNIYHRENYFCHVNKVRVSCTFSSA
jgi:hypothetical protein